MIDLHSHVLSGLDDGARSIEESLQILADAAREGVTAIAATPHVRDDYPTTAVQMQAGVERLRERITAEKIPVTLLPGGGSIWSSSTAGMMTSLSSSVWAETGATCCWSFRTWAGRCACRPTSRGSS